MATILNNESSMGEMASSTKKGGSLKVMGPSLLVSNLEFGKAVRERAGQAKKPSVDVVRAGLERFYVQQHQF